jgi:predicted ArsR family transcriptional regulator
MLTPVSPILAAIKVDGPQSTRTLAEALGVTRQAARQQLERLASEGLVEFATQRAGAVGRPHRLWTLTEAAQQRFPDGHAEALVEVLAGVREEFGEAGLARVVERREAGMRGTYAAALAGVDAADWRERGRRLAAARTREGYMAEWIEGPEGSAVLIENHCPICAAARVCQGFCRSELSLFRELLGPAATVERTEHALSGARRCAYAVRAV